MARRLRLLASLCAVALGAVLVISPPAGAEATTRVADAGWWWKAQTGVLTPLPPPPGVEEGQLVVQSTPDGAQAIAAVGAVLAEGQTSPVLTLDVASEGGGATAVVLACQAGSAWVGQDAGRWDTRPSVDCTTSVTGIPSDDGSQWTFALGPLQFEDQLSVVLVPGTLADAEAYPSFNLVFEAPTAASIATTEGAAPPAAPPTTTAPAPATAPAVGSSGAGTPSFSPPTSPAVGVPSAPAPVLGAEPALDDVDQGLTSSAPIVQEAAAAAVVEAPEPRTLARLVGGVILLAGLAGGAASRAGALGVGATATPEAPVVGGLARFRAERTADPQPVS